VPLRTVANFPLIPFMLDNGKNVALLTDVLEKMQRNEQQPGREAKRLKIRHNYDEDDVYERPRDSCKGGRRQWVATQDALMCLWVD
jgi:hypothetical protein